jgi:hypothetical protein
MRRARHIAFLLGAWGIGNGAVAAQDVDAGVRFFESAEFERAREAFAAALADEDLTREAATRAHQHLGAILQILGEEEGSRRHAAAAIALDPGVGPPGGAPGFEPVLAAARREQGQMAALRVEAPRSIPAMRDTRIVATLDPAPPGLVASLVLRCTVGHERMERSGAPPSTELVVTPPETATSLHCESEGITDGGATLFRSSIDSAGGAALVVAAIVVAVAVAAGGNDTVTVSDPSVAGWP